MRGESITVKVKLGEPNIARAGFGKAAKIASSTNSGEIAARAAAAKYLRCRASRVALACQQSGDQCAKIPAIYSAWISEGGVH